MLRRHIRTAAGLAATLALAGAARAQDPPLDLLIRGGHVLDAKNGVDALMDVGIAAGKIARVAPGIPPAQARKVVDATGLYVVPGLVDIHTHVFHGTRPDAYLSDSFAAVAPDGFTFRSGVTTVVDAGGAGWRNLRRFKEQVADRSQTRVLAFVNIVGSGMQGGPVEQDLADMDARLTALRIAELPELAVGIKVAHYMGAEWDPIERAVAAGRSAKVPVMVDFGEHTPPLALKELLLERLRPGDMLTHVYAVVDGRTTVVDERGQLRPYVLEARKRGVLFDLGHGGGSFFFSQAVPALRQGLPPDSLSTDLHVHSMNAGMKDMLNVMSKLMSLGLSLQDVVLRATWNPARQIQRPDLGHLGVGAPADVAVLRVREGPVGFLDCANVRQLGRQRLEAELTLRAGRVVWDLNGLAAP